MILRFILIGTVYFVATFYRPSSLAATFAGAVTNGMVTASGLVEASGVVSSRNNPGVIWAENDSGNPAVVYALDTQGRFLGTYALPGNTDNEDIGIGPGPVANVSYLYVADIGDNSSSRSSIALYQAPEPAVYIARQFGQPVSYAALKGMRTITLTYPDGAHNAESGFVDPITGDWFIITKESTTAHIYTVPKLLLDVTNKVKLSYVGSLAFDVPSGADISPLGNEIIVRQENFARLWSRTNGQSVGSALAGPSINIPVTGESGGEPNGEAIGFDYYGGGYFTLSDSTSTQPLRYFARTSFDGPTPPRPLVTSGAAWKFLDIGTDAGTAWRQAGYNDTVWNSGSGQFGFGDGDEQTTISYGPNPDNKFITTYFRKSFAATNVNQISDLTLKLLVADGAMVFLNGSLITSLNLVTDGTSYTTLAAPMTEEFRNTWQSYAVNPRLLVEGTNVIAAEVHLASVSATNMSFDLQMAATEAPAITNIVRLANAAKLFIVGSSNSPTTIQGTTILSCWTNLVNVVLTNGAGTFLDTEATNFNFRFYKALRAVP